MNSLNLISKNKNLLSYNFDILRSKIFKTLSKTFFNKNLKMNIHPDKKFIKKNFCEILSSNNNNDNLISYRERFFQNDDKTGILITLEDKPGILANITQIFAKNNVNLTYINSKPSKFLNEKNKKRVIDFFIDFEGKYDDENIKSALGEITTNVLSVNYYETEQVPWFPKSIDDINSLGRKLLSANHELSSDHPGFNDDIYRKRREEIVQISNSYNMRDGENIPLVYYTENEKKLWKFLYDKLIPLQRKYGCDEVVENLNLFIKEINLSGNDIPQIKTISSYLNSKTNTIFRPVGGLLSQREFLNGLAFRIFHSTQYLRHHSMPLYTPEPDIVHEILGHAILFANKDFADFSQEIGLASLAASDEDIKKIGTIYWFTVEFGLCLQHGERKIYGGGILSKYK